MSVTREAVETVLRQYTDPYLNQDPVSAGCVRSIEVQGDRVSVQLELGYAAALFRSGWAQMLAMAIEHLDGVSRADVQVDCVVRPHKAQDQVPALSNVKNIIAVASGKGGVGKSTVSVNLAVALQKQGYKVGLCDCDLYGPSVAHMFGSNARPNATEDNEIIPIESDGLKLISMGFLLEDPSPVIVRGPLATRYTQQFLKQVTWGELDYLILDLPPGTGDIQLTIVQTVALTGAIIVTTPQEVALIDARKAVSMFEKVNVSVMGFVENMSYFLSPSDGVKYHIFGEGGGAREAAALGVPLLGQIPIDLATREGGDVGRPVALADPAISEASRIFADIAKSVVGYAPA